MIHVKMADASRLNRFVYRRLLPLAHEHMDKALLPGEPRSFGRKISELMVNTLLTKPLRNKLGLNRTRYAYTAGAAVRPGQSSGFSRRWESM